MTKTINKIVRRCVNVSNKQIGNIIYGSEHRAHGAEYEHRRFSTEFAAALGAQRQIDMQRVTRHAWSSGLRHASKNVSMTSDLGAGVSSDTTANAASPAKRLGIIAFQPKKVLMVIPMAK